MPLFSGETLGSSDPTLLRAEFSQGHCVWILGFIGWCRHELHPCSKLSVNRPGEGWPQRGLLWRRGSSQSYAGVGVL